MSGKSLFPATLLALLLAAPASFQAAPAEEAALPAPSSGEALEASAGDSGPGEPLSPSQKKEMERRLSEARRRLKEAEREVAEIQRRLGEKDSKQVEVFRMATSRPRLGVLLETDPDPEVDGKGVLVRGVSPGGPAAEAGIRAGDILTHLNGQPLFPGGGEAAVKKIGRLLEGVEEGDAVNVAYLRGKANGVVTVRVRRLNPEALSLDLEEIEDLDLPEIPDLPELSEREIRVPKVRVLVEEKMPGDWYDVELAPLNAGLGKYFGASEGLLVVNAPPENGLKVQAGDVLLKIGGRKPASPSQAFRILRSYEGGEKFPLEILRDRKALQIEVTVPEGGPSRREKGFRWEERRERPAKGVMPPVAAVAPPAPPPAPAPPSPGR